MLQSQMQGGSRATRWRQVMMAGCVIDLMDERTAVSVIVERAGSTDGPAVAVMSANLDHVHHFGSRGRWHGSVGSPTLAGLSDGDSEVGWLNLIDGAPLVTRARILAGRNWPRLAGSDLIDPILDAATPRGLRVGFLGGMPETQALLAEALAEHRPHLVVAGWWAPERAQLTNSRSSVALAEEIRAAAVDILVVGLGKPRQELWIAEYGPLTGARALLAFGAVVDFLAGRVSRAPAWYRDHGAEWAWRLALEPRRLSRRYLVQGPPALRELVNHSQAWAPRRFGPGLDSRRPRPTAPHADGSFVGRDGHADVAVVVVTHNSRDDVPTLLKSLRDQARELAVRVVAVDNASTDGTLDELQRHPDVIAVDAGGNWGYAGGINRARDHVGDAEAMLVLNPDLTLEPGAVQTMLARSRRPGVGAVVPRLIDPDGTTYPSLRREPAPTRAFGDALLGRRVSHRPAWSAETDYEPESYVHPHPVDWATGAAVLIRTSVADLVGAWDERYFLYSEEVDYCRRIRQAGVDVWYEPGAAMHHSKGGSGTSPDLDALMALNRVRYFRGYNGPVRSTAFTSAVLMSSVLRVWKPGHRRALAAFASRGRRRSLPQPIPAVEARSSASPEATGRDLGTSRRPAEVAVPPGSVVIPAHNESAVIARTLAPLGPLAESGELEVIVVCNGCTDDTAAVARSFPGVQVVEIDTPSKTRALNTGDRLATRWPRIYLDADIEIDAMALADVFTALESRDLLAARPASVYDTHEAGPVVRAYYRARSKMPSLHRGLWGAGAYAVSRTGHERLVTFPDVTADDLWVDQAFTSSEKAVVSTRRPVVVRTPRTLQGLMAILRRTYHGNAELDRHQEETPQDDAGNARGSTPLRDLARSVRGARAASDAAVYLALAVAGRVSSARRTGPWERDDTSRR